MTLDEFKEIIQLCGGDLKLLKVINKGLAYWPDWIRAGVECPHYMWSRGVVKRRHFPRGQPEDVREVAGIDPDDIPLMSLAFFAGLLKG